MPLVVGTALTKELSDWLIANGMIHKGDYAQRVIIDVSVNDVVTFWVQQIGDTRIQTLIPPIVDGSLRVKKVPLRKWWHWFLGKRGRLIELEPRNGARRWGHQQCSTSSQP